MKVPFSIPDITDSEINEVTEVLRSGWITTGKKTKRLETELSSMIGSPKCVCLNSQTACAETSLRILGIGPGDEVITTAYTYTATAAVVCHVGAELKLIDIREDTLEMDYNALESAITKHTKAVIPVDIAGIPCDYDRIFEIVNRKRSLFIPDNDIQKAIGRIAVVADSAHALGAKASDKMVGNIADFSNFSFHAVKNFTTAEGGAMTWRHIDGIDDDEIYHKAQLYSLHGQSKDALSKMSSNSWEYDVEGPWYKSNMTDISAAIGLAQFRRYPEMLKRRKEIIEKYDNAFIPLGIKVLPHYTKDYSSSGHLYITRIPCVSEKTRSEIISRMSDQGISCNVHYKPLPLLTAYKNLGFDIKDYPMAYKYFINEITLPLYSRMSDPEVDYVIRTYKKIVSEYIK